MNAVFSNRFKDDLLREETKYAEISERLSGDFHERVAGVVREVIKWKGGDQAFQQTGVSSSASEKSEQFGRHLQGQDAAGSTSFGGT